jgi:hypothetical protein
VLAQGSHAITAVYNGDGAKNIQASTSNIVNQDVQATTGTIVTSTLNPSNVGTAVTFTATVTPSAATAATGAVSFLDGGVQIGTANLAGTTNQATFSSATLVAGPHIITAAYQGDSNYSVSTAAAFTQTVNKVTPTITWATPAAITYGTSLGATQLNAAVNGVAGKLVYTPAAGTVLTAGTQTLSVSFTPNDLVDYNATTATVPLVVNQASPNMTVNTSGTPTYYGASVTFTATISSGPTGTVTFYDGANAIGTGTLAGVNATFSTSTLSVGPHSITAIWAGNSNYTLVASSPIWQTVNKATPVITWPAPAPISYGIALTVTQLDATATTAGSFSYSPAAGTVLSAGSRTLTVTFTPADTTDYTTSTASVTLQVNQVTPAITWPAPAAISYGTALGATQLNASSGGIAGVFNYTPSAGTVLAAGAQTLSATFLPTDTTDYASPSATVSLTVNKATPTLTVSTSGSQSYYGNSVTFTATASSGPSGTVTFYDGSNAIGTGALEGVTATFTTGALAVGVHIITASWAGNNNFNPVTSSPITQTVIVTQTSTTVAAQLNPGIAGLLDVLNVTVKLTSGVATPAGTLTFMDTFNLSTVSLGSVALGSGSGSAATATLSPMLAPGHHSIVATYSGDADSAGSASAPLALTVNLATTAATVSPTPNPALVLAPIMCTATVTGDGAVPTGSVSIYANGTTLIGKANLGANGAAAIPCAATAVGSYQITAVYAGDTNDAAATSPAVTEAVDPIPTAAALGSSSTGGTSSQVILAATVFGESGPTPTGTVTFTSGSTTLGSAQLDSTGVATLNPNLDPGVSYMVVASYGGDALHSASVSAPLKLSGTATDFSVTVAPPTLTLASSQNGSLTVNVTSYSGFADTIGMGCASLPKGVTCHFSSLKVDLAANTTQSIQLTIDTNNPLGGGASAMVAHPGNRAVALARVSQACMILPFSIFFGFVFLRFRKRLAPALSSALLLLLAASLLTGLTGCSGISQSSAAPGTYVIQVFGAGVNSNDTHFQNVTLTITQ